MIERDEYGYKVHTVQIGATGFRKRKTFYKGTSLLDSTAWARLDYDESKPILEREYLFLLHFGEPDMDDLTINLSAVYQEYDLLIKKANTDKDREELRIQRDLEKGKIVREEIGQHSLGLWQYAFKVVSLSDLSKIVQQHLESLEGKRLKRAAINARIFLQEQINKDRRKGDAKALTDQINAWLQEVDKQALLANHNETQELDKQENSIVQNQIEALKADSTLNWKGIPIARIIEHFQVLTKETNTRGETLLSESDFLAFIQKGFLENHSSPKVRIKTRRKGLIGRLFYDFYNLAVDEFALPQRLAPIKEIMSNGLKGWTESSINNALRKGRSKEKL